MTELFSVIAKQAVSRLGLSPRIGHLDATSFHVDGTSNEGDDEGVIHVTRGYSRDHRPDLNQVILELVAENQAGIATLMRPLSGNQSDKTSFQEVVTRHIDHLQTAGIEVLVTDSSGFTPATIEALEGTGVTWVMSVPATITQAKDLREGLVESDFSPLTDGDEAARVDATYAAVAQRWLVVRSEAARERNRSTAERQLLKASEQERKWFDKLCQQEFSCVEDAQSAIARFEKNARVLDVIEHEVVEQRHYGKRGRPAKNVSPERITYLVRGVLAARTALLEERIERASRFILATNDVSGEVLSNEEVLQAYKDQSKVERGFRFLEPMFLASTLYLNKAERIMALLCVMTVCLLVYAAIEHRIRGALRKHGATVPDQKGKPTSRPTARWVFESFLDVHLLFITAGEMQVLAMNLQDELKQLLELLGPAYSEVYS